MALASTPTLMPLDQYAAILGIDPWHFNQVEWAGNPVRENCRDVWLQHSYMWPDRASREALAEAIAQAEARIANYLGFSPAPTFFEEEQHTYPRKRTVKDGSAPVPFPAWYDTSRRKTAHLDWLRFIEGGRRRVVEIETGVTVTYSDTTGDGFDDRVEITPTETAPEGALLNEIAVFAPDADTDPQKRIRSLETSIASDRSITITGRSSSFVDQSAVEATENVLEGADAGTFLDEIDVYWIYASDKGEDYAPCEFAWQESGTTLAVDGGILQPWNKNRSIVTPIQATWDEDNEEWDVACTTRGEPHLFRAWYYAGWPADDRGRLTAPYARAVAALATAYLVRPICGCGQAEQLADFWQEVPADAQAVWAPYEQLACPFGPQRGAWEAYKICQDEGNIGGVSI
ncbi:hypothetical protein GF373_17695 [bacterium]|nr:hypothetical protein [bacterium]